MNAELDRRQELYSNPSPGLSPFPNDDVTLTNTDDLQSSTTQPTHVPSDHAAPPRKRPHIIPPHLGSNDFDYGND